MVFINSLWMEANQTHILPAIPALERIPDTYIWTILQPHMFDLRKLPPQPPGSVRGMELWKLYDLADERDY